MKRFAFFALMAAVLGGATFGQVYNNGPLVSNAGAGFGGADASAITAGLNAFGFAVHGSTTSFNNRLADDFTVPCGQSWALGTIRVYAYQTQTVISTTSNIIGANYRIWK